MGKIFEKIIQIMFVDAAVCSRTHEQNIVSIATNVNILVKI